MKDWDGRSGGVWLTPTLGNGWVNFGGGFQNAAYRRDGNVVRLKGLIKSGTIGAGAFTLPAGYRPGGTHMASAVDGSNTPAARVDVAPGGQVTPQTGNNAFISLDGITFVAEL